MSSYEVLLIGIGLSMDAVAVSMTIAMVQRKNNPKLIEMAFLFAVFQGLMPMIGYWVGGAFSDVVTRLGGILVLLILGFIGCKMLCSGLSKENDDAAKKILTHKFLFIQAIATSIDALAVGVGLRAQDVEIVSACAIIAVTTLFLSLIAIVIGKRFGDLLGKKAEAFGGVLLIIIGIKAAI